MTLSYNDTHNFIEFQRLMIAQLAANSHKGEMAVEDCDYGSLLTGMQKHLGRFIEALSGDERDLPKAMLAAINLANFALITGININAEMVNAAMPPFEVPKIAGSGHSA